MLVIGMPHDRLVLLWLGVMHQVELSKLMPFRRISPVLIRFLARAALENLTARWRAWPAGSSSALAS